MCVCRFFVLISSDRSDIGHFTPRLRRSDTGHFTPRLRRSDIGHITPRLRRQAVFANFITIINPLTARVVGVNRLIRTRTRSIRSQVSLPLVSPPASLCANEWLQEVKANKDRMCNGVTMNEVQNLCPVDACRCLATPSSLSAPQLHLLADHATGSD